LDNSDNELANTCEQGYRYIPDVIKF